MSGTPPAEIVAHLSYGLGAILRLPVDEYYGIVEPEKLPEELDFPPASPRLYCVADKKRSGMHAHKIGSEKEIMVCVAGTAIIHLMNKDGSHFQIVLSRENDNKVSVRSISGAHEVKINIDADKKNHFFALYVPDGIWHTVLYSENTVLNVVASVIYDFSYYITDPEKYFTSEGLAQFMKTFPST